MVANKAVEIPVGDVIEVAMRDYGKHSLEERHLPDFRDGLKPVQRRILYTLFEDGILWSGKFTKCAAIVGNTLARYHPTGDESCYGALVGMTGEPLKNKKLFCGPNWSYPTIEGYGNFGSIDGDSEAAMRYPEAKLSILSQFLFRLSPCIKYTPNYLNNRNEPLFIPSTLPFLLLNGVAGVAVGITTNIPMNNLGEICDALIYMLQTPNISASKLMKYIKGPDWQYGGILWDRKQVAEAYATGKGPISWGLATEVKEKGKNYVVTIVGIPPTFNLKNFLVNLKDGKAFKFLNKKFDTAKAVKRINKFDISEKLDIQIEVTKKELMEAIVNFKFNTKNNWNITIRHSADNVEFKSINLLSFLTMWLDYCIKVHKEFFKLEINKLIREIRLDIIRIKIDTNYKKVIKLIRDESYDVLQKLLSCTDEEIDFVKRISLGSLGKTNVEKVRERIKTKKAEIDELKYNLKFTKKYLIKFFKEARTYSRERRTIFVD